MDIKYELLDAFKTESTHFFSSERVCSADNKHPYAYIIKSGYIKVTDERGSGGKKTIIILGPGDVFPLIWAFDHPGKAVYNYESMVKSELYKIDIKALKDKLASDMRLNRESLLMFVQLTWDLMERTKCLQVPYTYGKLLRLMPYLIAKFGEKIRSNQYKIPGFVTQEEVAQMLGTSRESVTKHFQLLREDGIVEKISHGFIINASNKILKEHLMEWMKHSKR